jgi:thiamine biosynthesis lipoprotein
MMKPLFLMFAIFAVIALAACGPVEPILITGNTMGTTYSVKVIDEVDAVGLTEKIEERLVEVNELMSTYLPNSEISRINQLPVGELLPVSPENLRMLKVARLLYQQSEGKFDITLGPLVRLWGFGPDPIKTVVPESADIAAALGMLGLESIEIIDGRLRKTQPVELDFSAIAKGYGVDELARLVSESGAQNYLVEIGGELRASGRNQNGALWRIGIEKPDAGIRSALTAIPLNNLAMATSGDYRNYFEADGVRYSHTIDPTTGYPITHNVVSVTVLAETTTLADGYATAIDVMGVEAGMALANRQNLPIFVILRNGSEFTTQSSVAFDKYMAAHE